MDDNLVSDIYYTLKDYEGGVVPENNEILSRINQNISLYGNAPIDELDSKYSWIKVKSPHISNLKFINTKGYGKYLKKLKEVQNINNKTYKLYMESMQKNGGYTKFPDTIEEPYPWNNFLMLKAYLCRNTKSIGFTYYVKNTYMIKPFNIVKHDWALENVSMKGSHYICKKCSVQGMKHKDCPSYEIFPEKDFMLSCNELLIKNIIE